MDGKATPHGAMSDLRNTPAGSVVGVRNPNRPWRRLSWMASIVMLFLGSLEASAAIPSSERQALIDLYNATNGPSWTNKTGWLGSSGVRRHVN